MTTPETEKKPESNPDKKPENKKGRPGDARRLLEAKVGAFVLFAVLCAAGAVFLLGEKKHVFENTVKLYAVFDDIQGLSEGAPVHLSGVTVGKVEKIGFDRKGDKTRITVRVDFAVSKSTLDLIRDDSVVTIGAQGLLGDKVVELTAGSVDAKPVLPGGKIDEGEATDINQLLTKAGVILSSVQKVADQAVLLISGIADPNTVGKLRGIIASLHALLRSVETGPGLAHALFYDQGSAKKVTDLVASFDRIATDLDTGLGHINRVLGATTPEGEQLINNLSHAARNVSAVAGDLHDTKMIAHLEKASANLDGAVADIAVLAHNTRAGQGTLGALLVDPMVYEQLLTILGGVARSTVLRTLVRYVIHQEDHQSPHASTITQARQ